MVWSLLHAGTSPVALTLTGATAGAVCSPDKAQPHPGYSPGGADAYRGYG